jgi:acyl-CoA reductase-like NAD-dependent aldehyde dehydrogenase
VVHRKPLGVVASIISWNWPLLIAIWHVIPALRTGNTVILKPSENTPVASSRFVELANTILPKGALNIVHGKGGIGGAMAEHSGIDKLIFTGSTPTGRRIMSYASVNLKRLTLELGGNDAGIVLPDVDVKVVAPQLFLAGFHNNGQTCACLKRLYVHESQYDEMCNEIAAIANNVKVGNGLEQDTDLGPCQNARANGARILSGGEAIGDADFFYATTIVADVSDSDRLIDEEQFGPVLPIIKYSNIDDVIEQSNKSESGLGGSV